MSERAKTIDRYILPVPDMEFIFDLKGADEPIIIARSLSLNIHSAVRLDDAGLKKDGLKYLIETCKWMHDAMSFKYHAGFIGKHKAESLKDEESIE